MELIDIGLLNTLLKVDIHGHWLLLVQLIHIGMLNTLLKVDIHGHWLLLVQLIHIGMLNTLLKVDIHGYWLVLVPVIDIGLHYMWLLYYMLEYCYLMSMSVPYMLYKFWRQTKIHIQVYM